MIDVWVDAPELGVVHPQKVRLDVRRSGINSVLEQLRRVDGSAVHIPPQSSVTILSAARQYVELRSLSQLTSNDWLRIAPVCSSSQLSNDDAAAMPKSRVSTTKVPFSSPSSVYQRSPSHARSAPFDCFSTLFMLDVMSSVVSSALADPSKVSPLTTEHIDSMINEKFSDGTLSIGDKRLPDLDSSVVSIFSDAFIGSFRKGIAKLAAAGQEATRLQAGQLQQEKKYLEARLRVALDDAERARSTAAALEGRLSTCLGELERLEGVLKKNNQPMTPYRRMLNEGRGLAGPMDASPSTALAHAVSAHTSSSSSFFSPDRVVSFETSPLRVAPSLRPCSAPASQRSANSVNRVDFQRTAESSAPTVEVAQSASQDLDFTIVTYYCNVFDPVDNKTKKFGRSVSLCRGPDGSTRYDQLRKAVDSSPMGRDVHEPLVITHINSDGTRSVIDNDASLSRVLRDFRRLGERAVLQCLRPEELSSLLSNEEGEGLVAAKVTPPIMSPAPPSEPAAVLVVPTRPTSRLQFERSTSAAPSASSPMALSSSRPLDYVAGAPIDGDVIAREFHTLSGGSSIVDRSRVISYLKSRYDSLGEPDRFEKLLRRLFPRVKTSMSLDEFAIVLLRLSQS